MRTYAEEELADFESGLLPGETEGGSLWIQKRKFFKSLKRHQTDGALTLREAGLWNSN